MDVSSFERDHEEVWLLWRMLAEPAVLIVAPSSEMLLAMKADALVVALSRLLPSDAPLTKPPCSPGRRGFDDVVQDVDARGPHGRPGCAARRPASMASLDAPLTLHEIWLPHDAPL